MKKKLIVTDIDGTLVNDQKEIMPETKHELKKLIWLKPKRVQLNKQLQMKLNN